MSRLLKFKISLILVGLILSIKVFSMEEPIERIIKVKTNDGKEILLSEDIWKIIPFFKKIIETPIFEEKESIEFKFIDSKNMQLIRTVLEEIKQKVNQHLPSYKIESDILKKIPGTTRRIIKSRVNVNDFPNFKKVLEFLELDEILKALNNNNLSIADLIISNSIPEIKNGELNLSDMGITDLFGLKYIKNSKNLKTLNLRNNSLTNISSGAFQNLNNLQLLYLSENQLTNISIGAFKGPNNLLYLYLENNRITSIEGGAFKGLDKLTSIDLGNNQLSRISVGMLQGLGDRLFFLNFENNPLRNVETRVFQSLNNLKIVSFMNTQLSNNNKNQIRQALPNAQINF